MGVEPQTQSSSGDSDSNSDSDSENSDSCSYSSSNSDSDSSQSSHASKGSRKSKAAAESHKTGAKPKLQQQFSVTSSETGLRLKIAAIPTVQSETSATSLATKNSRKASPKKKTPVPTAAAKKGNFDKPVEDSEKPIKNHQKNPRQSRSKVKTKKKSPLSESSSSSGHSYSECSRSDSSSDSDRDIKKHKVKRSPKLNESSTPGSRAGPKLSATVYSKKENTSGDENVDNVAERTSVKEQNSDTKVTAGDVVSYTSANSNEVNLKSAKTVSKSAVVTRKKVTAKKKSKAAAASSPAVPDKGKAAIKNPVKKPRGRPRTKTIPSNVSLIIGDEETSCSSSVGGRGGCGGGGVGGGSSSVRHSSPAASSSGESSSSDAESSSSSSSSSGSDSSAALAAACSLQVINEEDLAAILPEHQPYTAGFAGFGADGQSQSADAKTVQENGDGSSSEMELPPQLVNAAIQRATADSSSSENESTTQEMSHTSATHYASSLLQEFVAQTQLLSHTRPIAAVSNCALSSMTKVQGLADCVLTQSCPISEIEQMEPDFLSSEHLSVTNNQQLSPQQTEELSQINRDLAEITCVTDSVGILIQNPPSLDDCVDNSDFLTLDITSSSADIVGKTVVGADLEVPDAPLPTVRLKVDTVAVNLKEPQDTESKSSFFDVKRKRGRPRKVKEEVQTAEQKIPLTCDNIAVNPFCHDNDPPNVSPDSGILSNHNSPSHSPRRMESEDGMLKPSKSKLSTKLSPVPKRGSRSKSKSRLEPDKRDRSVSSEASVKRKNIAAVNDCKVENPSPIPKQEASKLEKKKNENKLDIAALDRMLYATDRVLYPPRRKVGRPPQSKTGSVKKGPGRPPKNKPIVDSADSDEEVLANSNVLSEVYAKRKDLNKMVAMPKKSSKSLNNWRDNRSDQEGAGGDGPLDPTWREIDLNPKYKDILSGYKSDHEIKSYKSCSRLLESGYKSDYGFKSGYKSDHCCKSGYKTDHKSGYKSDKSGYKSDHSMRNMRRKMRKLKKSRSVRDRSYYKNQKYFVSDQEILLLASQAFSCLTLGQSTSDSDSECRSQSTYLPSKFTGVRNTGSASSKITFGVTNRLTPLSLPSVTKVDLFAPAPVFSGLASRLNSNLLNYSLFNSNRLGLNRINKHSFGSLFTSNMSAFTHKFACPPITTPRSDSFSMLSTSSLLGKGIPINNNTAKQPCRNVSPKTKKSQKSSENIYPVFKREKSPAPVVNLFPQSQSSYVPNKSLSRNVFLNVKKPQKKSSSHWKKHKTQLVITPTKCHIPKSSGRLSRMSSKSSVESKHHRHKSKKMKKQRRSRSASRAREVCTKSVPGVVDQKFCQEMENLISHFMKLSHAFPKSTLQQSKVSGDKSVPENASKCVKRASKKRKGSDNTEVATPTSKRRHKKQFQESQSKGGKDKDTSANEHKLPLKKRHYHINPSTNNSLSLSLVATEFVENMKTENSKGSDPFLCTETDCPGDLKEDASKDKPAPKASVKTNASIEKNKKDTTNKSQEQHSNAPETGKQNTGACVSLHIDVSGNNCISHISPASIGTDDEFSIKKPVGEHSELSKKIYEASEKLKAVNKMVHDLEKSLPKTKESEIGCKDSKVEPSKILMSKSDAKNLNTQSSTGSSGNAPGTKHSPPVVTPKKRHRLEVDKLANSGLDLVVQSLSKKLSDDKVLHLDKNAPNEKANHSKLSDSHNSKIHDEHSHNHRHSSSNDSKKEDKEGGSQSDSVKSGSSRSMSKNLLPPTQKSEIITRKKNRLEGLTSNLVSKINPSSATKVLDTLMSNNLRKSIESRILERSKTGSQEPIDKSIEGSRLCKEGLSSTRATVIKSPISKSKLPAEAKKLPKGTEILIEETVVYNYDKPTGIFEPSVDIELQIPKSSISVNHVISENSLKGSSKAGKSTDNKNSGKVTRVSLEGENQIPMVSLPSVDKNKKLESIASVISDKIQESGHNLRHSKRNHTNESEEKSDASATPSTDRKKKKSVTNLLKESKLRIVPKPLQNKVPQDIVLTELPKSEFVKISEIENVAVKNAENIPLTSLLDSSIPLKKRAKRRKTINRTGFPSIKKKKKKFNPPTSAEDELPNESSRTALVSLVPLASDLVFKSTSAFDRVPKVGEATNTFVERTTRKKHGELKVVLNKDECPKQGRVSVIALERLQGRAAIDNNNISIIKPATLSSSAQTIVTAVASDVSDVSLSAKTPLTINTDPAILDSVAKWEILSETDSLPPLSSGSIGNDPEDSIPLSLLNFKSERPNSGLEQKSDRSKRKLRDVSPCDSIENVSLSKRAIIEKSLKSKSSSVTGECHSMKRLTRRNDTPTSIDTDDAPLISTINKNKRNDKYTGLLKPSQLEMSSNNTVEDISGAVQQDSSNVPKIVQRRKSRSCNMVKRLRDMSPSSRDSSLETVKTIKKSPKSRDASVETVKHLQDNCLENDPLPLQEKEIDFEKSIDVLSKSIINKKRITSSRDDSPASSVERGYRSEKEKGSTKRNPKIKKKYLVAGLFSNYYKVNDPKSVDHKAKLVYNSADHPNGLVAPPPYCERWVRQRKIHFTLPYDIWWQHQYNQPVPSWNYRKIRTNVYYDVKPTPDGCESQACSCPASSECQDDCINRMVYAECSPQLCPCKDLCKNQRIQRHEISPGLDKFMTENKGWGVRTKLPIVNGTFILEYVGEVVSDKEFKDRMASRYVKDTHHYCLHLDGGLVIDGHRMGGEGRFVNHSCQPNCEMQKWSVNGLFRMALFALRDIKPGEELTYDYNFSLFNPAEGQACKCDSENCRGVIGGKSQRITKSVVKNQTKTSSSTSISVGTATVTPLTASNQNQNNLANLTPNRVGRPRKAIKTNMKPNGQSNVIVNVNSPERNEALSFMKEVQNIHASNRFWQEPQMKPLTNKEKLMVKDRHCFLHRNLDKVRRIRERMLSHPALAASQQLLSNIQPSASQIMACNASGVPNSSAVLSSQAAPSHPSMLQHNICNPSVFLTRLHALRTPRNIRTRRLAKAEDNPELSKHARLANVFRELYNVVVNAKDDKGELLCTPLLRRKASRNAEVNSSPLDLTTIQGNIETGHYKSIALFDTHFNSLFTTIIKTLGRTSNQGIISQQLRKVYNNAKLDFAEQLTTILGTDEPLPQGFLQKRKQEEVILCVCGLHGEEGLMVQCGGEGDQNQNGTTLPSPATSSKTLDTENLTPAKSNVKSSEGHGGLNSDTTSAAGIPETMKNTAKGCGVWQHARCMAVTDIGEPYYCHRCQPREVNLEISLDEYTDEGHQFYLSLLRGDLQVRQGDTVYVLRDIPIDDQHPDCSLPLTKIQINNTKEGTNASTASGSNKQFNKRIERSKKGKNMSDKEKGNKDKVAAGKNGDPEATDNSPEVRKHTYKTIGAISVSELDIFRVERLWKDNTTGQRYVYGHHYLRPHETYHEPTRKFFPNEVMRVPLYEAVPIELVMSQCWVMDLNTFCKGRPLAAKEEHVYICELRVDKCARLFTKISRPKYPVCTKSYAFEMFPQRLKITRTYAPHEVSPSLLKNRPRKPQENGGKVNQEKQATNVIHQHPALPAPKPKGAPLLHAPIVKTRATQKSRLNNILLKLLTKMPTKQPLDMSYLLDGRRQRKKMISS